MRIKFIIAALMLCTTLSHSTTVLALESKDNLDEFLDEVVLSCEDHCSEGLQCFAVCTADSLEYMTGPGLSDQLSDQMSTLAEPPLDQLDTLGGVVGAEFD